MKLPKLLVKKPKYSNFDLSHIVRFTAKPGVLYPILIEDTLPGETFNISIRSLIKTYPLLAPLMGTFKCQFDFFKVPLRYYVPNMEGQHLDAMPVGKAIPQLYIGNAESIPTDYTDPEASSLLHSSKHRRVEPSSWLEWFGVPVGFNIPNGNGTYQQNNPMFCIPAHYYRAYWDIFRSYYINQQEPNYFYTDDIYTSFAPQTGTFRYLPKHKVAAHDVEMLQGNPYHVGDTNDESSYIVHNSIFDFHFLDYNGIHCNGVVDNTVDQSNFSDILNEGDIYISGLYSVSDVEYGLISNAASFHMFPRGLALRSYKNDYITSVLNSTKCNAARQFVNVENNKVSISQITLANKLQTYLELSASGNSRYKEWIRAQFGITPKDDLMIPELLTSISTYLNFEDVVQTSSDAADQPLGSLAGKGSAVLGNGNGEISIYTEEHSIIMCMFSLVPIPDYYQGFSKFLFKRTFDDIFKPAVDNIGFQDVCRLEYSGQNSFNSVLCSIGSQDYFPQYGLNEGGYSGAQWKNDLSSSVGKQPAWLEYKTALNRLHGDFTESLRYWTNARQMFQPQKYHKNTASETSWTPVTGTSYEFFSSYIIPELWNFAFADTSNEAENFMVQTQFGIYRKSPMSKNLLRKL